MAENVCYGFRSRKFLSPPGGSPQHLTDGPLGVIHSRFQTDAEDFLPLHLLPELSRFTGDFEDAVRVYGGDNIYRGTGRAVNGQVESCIVFRSEGQKFREETLRLTENNNVKWCWHGCFCFGKCNELVESALGIGPKDFLRHQIGNYNTLMQQAHIELKLRHNGIGAATGNILPLVINAYGVVRN